MTDTELIDFLDSLPYALDIAINTEQPKADSVPKFREQVIAFKERYEKWREAEEQKEIE